MTPNKRLTLLTLCFAVLVAQVDMAVVNLATRPIGAYFNAGVGACSGYSTRTTSSMPYCC